MADKFDSRLAGRGTESDGESVRVHLTGWSRSLVTGICVFTTLWIFLFNMGYLNRIAQVFYSYVYPAVFTPLVVGTGVMLTFLLSRALKRLPRDKVPWYDRLLAIVTIPVFLYAGIWAHPMWRAQLGLGMGGYLSPSTLEVVLGALAILSILETARRVFGWVMVIIPVFFFLFARFGAYIPGAFQHAGYAWEEMLGLFYLNAEGGIFSLAADVCLKIIAPFILFSRFLLATGAGEFFIKLAFALVGRVRGGAAKAAVIASAMFGVVSGSSTSNVVASGTVTIPTMKRMGYRPEFAAAVEAVASCGGQIMPPVMGAAAFIMSEVLGVPYARIVMAAALPALIYYAAVFIAVDVEAVKSNLRPLERAQIPSLRKTLAEGWHFIFPILVLLLFLVFLGFSPAKSAYAAVGTLIIASLFRKETRMSPREFLNTLNISTRAVISMFVIAGAIGMIASSVSLTGMAVRTGIILAQIAGGNLIILAICAGLAAIILGTEVPSTAAYILLGILVAPSLVELGVPQLAAHMFVFYMGISAGITPPVCVPAYTAATLAGAPMMKTAVRACLLGAPVYVAAFAFVYHPGLLMIGSRLDIIPGVAVTIVAALSLATGISGYLFGHLNWGWRAPLILAPFPIIFGGTIIGYGAIAAVLVLSVWRLMAARLQKRRALAASPTKEH